MKRRNLVIGVLILVSVGTFTFINMEKDKEVDETKPVVKEEVKVEEEKVKKEKVENDSANEKKVNVARNLFDSYMKGKFSEKRKTLTEYRINKITFVKDIDDFNYTVDVCYDVKMAEGNNYWAAGNGELGDDGWVVNKSSFLDIEKRGEGYYIKNIYTG